MRRHAASAFKLLIAHPVAWISIGAPLFFAWAGTIPAIRWNAIEMMIGANLLAGRGAIVAPLDPPALWRPPLAWLLCAAVEVFVRDPLMIFQVVYTISLTVFLVTSFYAAKRIWGPVAAHSTCLFIMVSPALTSTLVNHVLGLSHIVFLLVIGPAIWLTVLALERPSAVTMAGAGAFWALSYLARPDSLPAFAVSCCFLLYAAWRSASGAKFLPAAFAFMVILAPYLLYNRYVKAHYGLSGPSALTIFYASEGWFDGSNNEVAGYARVVDRYGSVEQYGNSLAVFLWRHPDAMLLRMRGNLPKLAALYSTGLMCPTIWFSMLPFAVIGAFWLNKGRLIYAYCSGLFISSLGVVLFHIDPRYATVGTPALMLLLCGGVYAFWRLISRRGRSTAVFGAACLILAALDVSRKAYIPFAHELREGGYGRSHVSTDIAKNLAMDFQRHVASRAQTALLVEPGSGSRLAPEDSLLLVSYFAHTGIAWQGAGPYAIDKIFSMVPKTPQFEYVAEPRFFETDLLLRTDPLSVARAGSRETFFLIRATNTRSPVATLSAQQIEKLDAIVRQKYPAQDGRFDAILAAVTARVHLAPDESAAADKVGCGQLALRPDRAPDRVFRIDISTPDIPSNAVDVESIELERTSPWGVYRTAAMNYVLGVARAKDGPLLNKGDGTIAVPLEQDLRLWVFACNDRADGISSEYRAKVRIGDTAWAVTNSVRLNANQAHGSR